jgi:uncharacterized protein
MIVDIFTHFMPPQLLKKMESLGPRFALAKRMMAFPELHNVDARFRAMDGFGDYRQIISLANPPFETLTTPAEGRELVRVSNDCLAELVQKHPDRFAAFVAGVPMHNMELNLEEIERAITTLGAGGIQIFTNVNEGPIDDPSLEPLFSAMEKYDLPIWLHPSRTASMTDYKTEAQSRFEMWWCFGSPYETAVAVSRLILSGLFDRHPRLKIIKHHMGGMIPYFDKSIEGGMAVLGTRTPNEDYSKVLPSLKRPFMDYYHMIYADTALFGASRGLACGMDFFGADHVAFGTDAPMGPIAATRDGVAHLNLVKSQLEAVFHGNAEKLINRPIV